MSVVTQPADRFDAMLNALPAIPHDNEGPVFRQPWEAEVFAIVLSLHASGLFSWNEWAEQLHASIQAARQRGDPDLGDTYYSHWLNALETLVVTKGLGSPEQLSMLYERWEQAAAATPHGHPIELA